MKTARFSSVVEAAGHPDTHLLFTNPETDKALQRAVKGHRVMTVIQSTVGQKKDYGEVGLRPGASRQFLVFPKSLARFAGKRIVGIDYDALESAPKGKAAARPRPKTRKTRATTEHTLAEINENDARTLKVVPFPKQAPKKSGEVQKLKAQVRRAIRELEKGRQVAAFKLLKSIAE